MVVVSILIFTVPSGAPLDFTVSVNRTTLECSWGPLAENERNGVITSYTLTCLVDDVMVFNEELSPSVGMFSIDFYSPNTTYTCSIYASTNSGDGPSSTGVTVTTTDGESHLKPL